MTRLLLIIIVVLPALLVPWSAWPMILTTITLIFTVACWVIALTLLLTAAADFLLERLDR